MILNCCDRSDRVSTVTKTRLENDVIDHIDMVYAKNEIDLPWLIILGMVFDEN